MGGMRWATFFAVVLGAASLDCAAPPARPPPWRPLDRAVILTEGIKIQSSDGSVMGESGEAFVPPFASTCMGGKLTGDHYKQALANGARRVRIKSSNYTGKFYGVLALCRLPPNVTGVGARRYGLIVPDDYLEATVGGQISVLYEYVSSTSHGEVYSWQLWLSREAFE